MAQKTLPAISDKPAITIRALRDLHLEGWERQEVSIKCRNEQSIMVQLAGDVLQVTCMENAELAVPLASVIQVDKVGGDGEFQKLDGVLNIQSISGDASFQQLQAPMAVRSIGGDCSVDQVNTFQFEKIGGDATIKSVTGPLSIRHVGGDGSFEDVAACQIDRVSGDCQIHGIHGDLTIQRTGGDFDATDLQGNMAASSFSGDCTLCRVQGNMSITSIGGDAWVEDFTGGITISTTSGDFTARALNGSLKVDRAGGDARLDHLSAVTRIRAGGDIQAGLDSGSSLGCNLQAGGDISVIMNPNAQANLQITSNGHDIAINFGEQKMELSQRSYQMAVGNPSAGQEKPTELVFTAGGDVIISGEGWQPGEAVSGSAEATGAEPGDAHPPFGPDISNGFNFNPFDAEKFAVNVAQAVASQVEQATRSVEQQVKAAMHQLEGIKPNNFGPVNRPPVPQVNIPGAPVSPNPPSPIPEVSPEKTPITDEERLLILEMVRDQKITIEQAEKLLQALEGQGRRH